MMSWYTTFIIGYIVLRYCFPFFVIVGATTELPTESPTESPTEIRYMDASFQFITDDTILLMDEASQSNPGIYHVNKLLLQLYL